MHLQILSITSLFLIYSWAQVSPSSKKILGLGMWLRGRTLAELAQGFDSSTAKIIISKKIKYKILPTILKSS
jgi:hypothetical protein